MDNFPHQQTNAPESPAPSEAAGPTSSRPEGGLARIYAELEVQNRAWAEAKEVLLTLSDQEVAIDTSALDVIDDAYAMREPSLVSFQAVRG